MMKQIKELQKKNESIREKIDDIIGINHPLYSPLWLLINELIDNEIKQEELCGE